MIRTFSAFDPVVLTHQFNANQVAELPVRRERRIAGGAGKTSDQLIGGWQLSGISRRTSGYCLTVQERIGFPASHYFRGFGKLTGQLLETTRNKNGPAVPNLFLVPAAARGARQPTGRRNGKPEYPALLEF